MKSALLLAFLISGGLYYFLGHGMYKTGSGFIEHRLWTLTHWENGYYHFRSGGDICKIPASKDSIILKEGVEYDLQIENDHIIIMETE